MLLKRIQYCRLASTSRFIFTIFFAFVSSISMALVPQNKGLGLGYSTDQGRSLGVSCLKLGKVNQSGGSAATLHLGQQQSMQDMLMSLGVNLDVDVSYEKFSLDAKASYARYVQETDQTLSFLFSQQIQLPKLSIQPDGYGDKALNATGLDASKKGPEAFRTTCGDEFVQGLQMGANLFVTVKIIFSSEVEKNRFTEQTTIKYSSIFNLTDDIKLAIDRHNIHGELEVSAYQQGGTPESLSNILSGGSKKGYFTNSCTLANIDQCEKILDSIVSYARDDFSKQLKVDSNGNASNAYPVAQSVDEYTKFGIKVGPSLVSEDVRTARKNLGKQYDLAVNVNDISQRILKAHYGQVFTLTTRNGLSKAVSDSHDNIELLTEKDHGIVVCFNDIPNCVSTSKTLLGSLTDLSVPFIDQFRQAYQFTDDNNQAGYALPAGEHIFILSFPDSDYPSSEIKLNISEQKNYLDITGSDPRYSINGRLVASTDQPDLFKGTINVKGKNSPITFTKVNNPILVPREAPECYPIRVDANNMWCVLHVRVTDNPKICGGGVDFDLGIGQNKLIHVAPGQTLLTGCRGTVGHDSFKILKSGYIHCDGAESAHPNCNFTDEPQ